MEKDGFLFSLVGRLFGWSDNNASCQGDHGRSHAPMTSKDNVMVGDMVKYCFCKIVIDMI